MQRLESSILGNAFVENATEKKQDNSVLEQCESLVTQANNLLKGEKNWYKFEAIRGLLSTVRDWKVESNFDGFSAIEIWLRYQLVCVFRKILASETLSTITDKGTTIHLGNFKEEFEKVNDDPDGVRKDICDDFIYRCGLPTLQAAAQELKTDVSIELLLKPGFPDGALKRNVTIPLMSPGNGGMPYFATRTRVDLMIDPLERRLSQSPESFTDEVNRERDIANGYVKDSLIDRITQFGISDPLPPISFDAFCALRSKKIAAPVANKNHPKPWVKILIGLSAAVLGAAVGALVGVYLLTGLVAFCVATAVGFGVGALIGWAGPKLIQCCCGRAKQPAPVVVDEHPAKQPVSHSPRHSNLELDQFHQRGREATVQAVKKSSAVMLVPLVGNQWMSESVPLLVPKSLRR